MKNKTKKYRIVSLLVVLVLALAAPSSAFAWDGMAAVTSDFGSAFYDDALEFLDVIITYSGCDYTYGSHNPYATWWKEESSGGVDDTYADDAVLSLLFAHGSDNNGQWTVTQIAFPSGGWIDDPNTVRLGYDSPDDDGINIWNFFITCTLFKDTSYPSWAYALTGTHMLLGFKNSPTISSSDLEELAHRLTGSGGYSQQNVQDSFFATFVEDDGTHDNNIGRILAENTSVADNDEIDSFVSQTTVDATKLCITCP